MTLIWLGGLAVAVMLAMNIIERVSGPNSELPQRTGKVVLVLFGLAVLAVLAYIASSGGSGADEPFYRR